MEVYEVYVAYFFSGIATPAARNDVPFLRVILNDSEESHRVSEEYIFYGKPPSREFAAVAALLRKDGKTNLTFSFGVDFPAETGEMSR